MSNYRASTDSGISTLLVKLQQNLLPVMLGAAVIIAIGLGLSAYVLDRVVLLLLGFVTIVLVGMFAFASNPRRYVDLLLFASIASITLNVYQIPLIAGQSLQLLRLLLLAGIGAWVVSMPVVRARVPAAFIFLLLFTLWSIFSGVMWGENTMLVISMSVALLFGCLYVLWLPQVIHNEQQVQIFVRGIIATGAIVIGFAVYQYFAWFTGVGRVGYGFQIPFSALLTGSTEVTNSFRLGALFRVTLPFSTPSHLAPAIAAVLLTTIPLQWLPNRKGRVRLVLLAYHLVMFGLLLNTGSRGAWIAFATGVAVLLFFDPRILLKKPVWVAAIIGLVIVGSAFATLPDLREAVTMRLDRSATSGSDELHMEFLLIALRMWAEKPILGFGLGNYEVQTGLLHAHNMYASTLAELGLVGLILMLAWLGATLGMGFYAVRYAQPGSLTRAVAIGLLAAMVALAMGNIFQQFYYSSFNWAIAGALGAVYFVARAQWLGRQKVLSANA